jgi:hypothetical protein
MAATVPVPRIAGYSFDVAANLADAATRKRLSPAALRAFFKMMKAWGIKDQEARELLGGISAASFYALKKDAEKPGLKRVLDQDRLTRISYLVGIFKALNILYSRKLADAWIRLPNKNAMFSGGAPLEYMVRLGIPGMSQVRRLLDSYRGGM